MQRRQRRRTPRMSIYLFSFSIVLRSIYAPRCWPLLDIGTVGDFASGFDKYW